MSYQPGDIILDKYKIEARLGQGASGDVFLVTYLPLNQLRALKVLLRENVTRPEFERAQGRFWREAQLGAQLNSPTNPNPHLLLIYDLINNEKMAGLVIEYAPGKNLADRIQQTRDGADPIPVMTALQIALEVAQGLSALHSRDIVHRDIKPANILFDHQAHARVADLGLVQTPNDDSHRNEYSQPVHHPGTATYMSPEQINAFGLLTPASDIYALGLVLFELLTGRSYAMQKPGTRASQLRADLPVSVDDLLVKMLAKNPEDRPWDGRESAALLQKILESLQGQQVEAQRLAAQQVAEQKNRIEAERQAQLRKQAEAEAAEKARLAQIEQERGAKDRELERVQRRAEAAEQALQASERARQAGARASADSRPSQPALPAEKTWLARFWPALILAGVIVFFIIRGFASSSASPAVWPTTVEVVDISTPTIPLEAPAVPAASGKIIGISMPTKTSTRWISDGESMVKSFEALGYTADLQFADNDINNQLAQIENMVTKGVNVLVIAAVDGSTMSDVLQKAHDAGILVVAYDRLITKTANVDYYATFDNFGVGVIQGTQLVTGLGLKDGKTGPFNVELFGGSPDDTNAFYFYDGAMSVIQPYIDAKQIVIQSGQVGMDKVGTLRWLAATAQSRMENLLSAFYTDKKVDGVLSPYDGLSIGILSALKGVGYCTATQPCPVVTGQDSEVASIKSIIAGEQKYSVFKDTRALAAQTSKMVDQALKGETVEVNDTKTYNNGVKIVPSYLLIPISIDISNYQKELLDSGYIKAADLK